MRLRLVHTLSLMLLAAVGVSVAAMGGVGAWHLNQGFSAYVQARDVERLDRFVALTAARLADEGGVAALQDRRLTVPMLLADLARDEGDTRPRRTAAPERGPGGGGAAPPGPPDAFGARLALFHPDGRRLAGRPLAPGPEALIERPIRLNGELVAVARLRPIRRVADEYEVRFLRSQYLGIAGVAGGLMASALGLAWWLSRRWAQPLAAVQAATARMARGELSVRVPFERHDEIGDVVRNVNLMAESLQRMEGARRRWIADLSHELRTPLAGLRAEVEALVDGVRPFTPAAARSLHEEVLRLGALVDDLHLLAMADLQSLPCHCVPCDAVTLVDEALQRHAPRLAARGLALGWAEPSGPAGPRPCPVHADPARIAQLLGNLLENSLRYTDAPGRVTLAVAQAGEQVHLQLNDSAPGVDAADLPHLFEPLYRADAARSRHHGGSGLGLAIGEAIVQAHGGRIAAQASPLGGLQVNVWLPVHGGPKGAR